jgi:hypothetical protein
VVATGGKRWQIALQTARKSGLYFQVDLQPVGYAVAPPLRGPAQAEMVDQRSRRLLLAEGERVGLGAGLEERDLQCPLADRVVLAYELVEPALSEQAVPVLGDVHAA